jgi:hypothetical protein
MLQAQAMRGNLESFSAEVPILVLMYCVFAFANAYWGYQISIRVKQQYAFYFQRTAAFQMALIYFIPCFLPMKIWSQMQENLWSIILLAVMDVSACLVLTWSIFSFRNPTQGQQPALDAAVWVGIAGLLAVAFYPIQFSLGNAQMARQRLLNPFDDTSSISEVHPDDYWSCIHRKYSLQGVALSAFVYIPASWVFAMVLFGSTLRIRNIITPFQFAIGMVGAVVSWILLPALSMEYQCPYVSTQRLYLPCEEPMPGSWEEKLMNTLDTSILCRYILRNMGLLFLETQ